MYSALCANFVFFAQKIQCVMGGQTMGCLCLFSRMGTRDFLHGQKVLIQIPAVQSHVEIHVERNSKKSARVRPSQKSRHRPTTAICAMVSGFYEASLLFSHFSFFIAYV
jgi:hypothetical protein